MQQLTDYFECNPLTERVSTHDYFDETRNTGVPHCPANNGG
jgi:hypothetical protein